MSTHSKVIAQTDRQTDRQTHTHTHTHTTKTLPLPHTRDGNDERAKQSVTDNNTTMGGPPENSCHDSTGMTVFLTSPIVTTAILSRMPFSRRPTSHLLIKTWHDQDVTLYQKWSFYVSSFKGYSLNRHTCTQTDRHTDTDTDTTKTLPLPYIYTREVKSFGSLLVIISTYFDGS